jgi:hypothetical protein
MGESGPSDEAMFSFWGCEGGPAPLYYTTDEEVKQLILGSISEHDLMNEDSEGKVHMLFMDKDTNPTCVCWDLNACDAVDDAHCVDIEIPDCILESTTYFTTTDEAYANFDAMIDGGFRELHLQYPGMQPFVESRRIPPFPIWNCAPSSLTSTQSI